MDPFTAAGGKDDIDIDSQSHVCIYKHGRECRVPISQLIKTLFSEPFSFVFHYYCYYLFIHLFLETLNIPTSRLKKSFEEPLQVVSYLNSGRETVDGINAFL